MTKNLEEATMKKDDLFQKIKRLMSEKFTGRLRIKIIKGKIIWARASKDL